MATKEANDIVAFVETFADAVLKAKADNKLDWSDAQYLMPLMAVGREAIKNMQAVVEEVKNANGEDSQELYTRSTLAVLALVEAFLR